MKPPDSGPSDGRSDTGELLFELPGDGRALFTSRAEGNMSSVGGLRCQNGADARARTCAQHGLKGLARGYQVHGTTVLSIRDEAGLRAHGPKAARPAVEADGHAIRVPAIGAMVLAADCLPIAIGSEHGVAVVHAGWRGLAAGVIEEGVRALRGLGEDPAGNGEIAAIVGPGAGSCCYEVGEEVHEAFGGVHRDGRRIDLKAIARERLTAAGVGDVRDVGLCTICDERFFSFRREASAAGRQAGIAWLTGQSRG